MNGTKRLLIFFLFCLLLLNPISAQNTNKVCSNVNNFFSTPTDQNYANQLCQEINRLQNSGNYPSWLIPAVTGILFYITGPIGLLIIGMLMTYTGLWWFAFIIGTILILMPFGAIFWIVYGFLRELRIFKKTNVANIWIALTAATAVLFPLPVSFFQLSPIGFLRVLSAYAIVMFYFRMLGWVAMIGFFLTFTVGVYYFYLRKKRHWSTTAGVYSAFRGEVRNLRMELAEISEAVADAAHALASETDPNKRVALEASLRELQDRRRDVQERLTELHESTRNM